jgi:branched-chain amino acid transport system permease protein
MWIAGRPDILWALILGLVAAGALPTVLDLYVLINATGYVSMAIFALSLALVWGYGGILCFGQAAFFGLGSYAYAIAAINLGDTTLAVLPALLVPAAFAAIVGYFLFYGRLSDVYLGVITLTTTLILFKLFNSTGGDNIRIGKARIGGFNGLPETPGLNWPFQPQHLLDPTALFVVAVISLLVAYLLCKAILATSYGRAVVAVRESEVRAELLGYDTRFLKLTIFVIGAGLAGWAGMLFANSVFVSPTLFSLQTTAQVMIWVVVGGVGTLVGPVAGCILLQMLSNYLGTVGWIDPNVVLGVILIGCVLFVPRGIQPTLRHVVRHFISVVYRPANSDSAKSSGRVAP